MSPARSLTAKKQQQQQQQQAIQDTAPVYDHHGGGSYSSGGYDAAPYSRKDTEADRFNDREGYSYGWGERDRFERPPSDNGGYQAPPPRRLKPASNASFTSSKPPNDSRVNYKRLFYGLLLLLLLSGIGVGIWAGVHYGRKNAQGSAAPAAPAAPTNFTMSLSAGGKNGQQNCTDWFSTKSVGVTGGLLLYGKP